MMLCAFCYCHIIRLVEMISLLLRNHCHLQQIVTFGKTVKPKEQRCKTLEYKVLHTHCWKG